MNAMYETSTADLATRIDNPGTKIIDVRPVDAYNGWPLFNESCGGHIRGAKSLPLK